MGHTPFIIAVLTALIHPTIAFAQQADNKALESTENTSNTLQKRRFTLTDFTQFSPVTALDMVRRIPGFSIEDGDGKRGFGDNAGNVLIDGNRPSTKAETVSNALTRIPASQVDYIELIEAAGADGEARGQGQVVNVVRKKTSKISGTYEASVELGERRWITPFGIVSTTIKSGDTGIDLSAGYFAQGNRETGTDLFLNGSGATTEFRSAEMNNLYQSATLSAALRTKLGAAKVNLNSKVDFEDFTLDRDSILFNPARTRIGDEVLRSHGPNWAKTIEFGGDVEFGSAKNLTTKTIGLYRFGDNRSTGNVETRRPPNSLASDFVQDEKRAEGIFRVQNDFSGIKSHAIQFGAEVAYNSLKSEFTGSSTSNGVSRPFPAANVNVSEWRFEPFVSDVWSISPEWKLEGGLVFEKSQIKVRGDNNATRSFSYFKPQLVATWTASKATRFEFRAKRDVAQLDFGEFATSIDLGTNGLVDAGNAELVPEKTIALSALVRHKFLDRGSIQLKGEYEMVRDTLDIVPVFVRDASGAVLAVVGGAGNIGNSKRWNGELEITLPFDWLTKPIGIKGLELNYTGHYHGSRVTDPVTNRTRRMSDRPLWHQDWRLRHDLGKSGFAWGLDASARYASTRYNVDQTNSLAQGTEYTIFAEYRKFKYGTLKLSVNNPFDVYMNRQIIQYSGTRASNLVTSQLIRDRSRDRRFLFSLSGKF